MNDWVTSALTASKTPGGCGRGPGNVIAAGPRGQSPNAFVTAAFASAVVMSPTTPRMTLFGWTYLVPGDQVVARDRRNDAYVACGANGESAP